MTEELTLKWAGRQVTTEADGREFIDDCERIIGGGFHPDTRFDDYVISHTGGRRTFTDAEAEELEARITEAFEVLGALGLDVYEISLDRYRHYHNIEEGDR